MRVIKRPFVWMLASIILLFLIYRAFHSEKDDARYYVFQGIWEERTSAVVTGQIERCLLQRQEEGEDRVSIYLKDCRIELKDVQLGNEQLQDVQLENGTAYELNRLLVYYDKEIHLEPGNRLYLSGNLREFSQATNPGQFHQRQYYKEKGIYYQFQADRLEVVSEDSIRWKSMLYYFRDRMQQVYLTCLPRKEGGIVSAMILGEKSLLDMDIKKLYQQNGIGHLLAISGLHVTILGMACYQLLKRLGVPVKAAAVGASLSVVGYGIMTDFGVSTNRAVIMMVLLFLADCVERSYDRQSALAFSGICILLQKPFALFSCSFLLSFGAMTGMELLSPVFGLLLYGDEENRRKKKRKRRIRDRELRANHFLGGFYVSLFHLWDKILSMMIASLSVQLVTLPIMLYFFYEIPLYGILLNLLVIPLASLLVLLSFVGGFIGCIFLPAGRWVLGGVYFLLKFYEILCRFFQRLPGQIQILGRPEPWVILVYYVLLFAVAGWIWWMHCQGQKLMPAPWAILGICTLCFLFVPVSQHHFQLTMLDVGQGDSLFLHTESGKNILIDGGSTSVSKVGTYRILPYLKYKGVRCLDHMILTHCDEDHMNGLMEILEQSGTGGVKVKSLLIPDVAEKEGYQSVLNLAQEKGIPVTYLSRGDHLQSGELSLLCLNPEKGFVTDSVNAASVTLSLRYGTFSCLLTGDLEGAGEEQVKEIFRQSPEQYDLADTYTVLKVAHHGSKNSTDVDFLDMISPRLDLISCGKKNRYGHPHEELLRRLEDCGSLIYKTSESGAITVEIQDGKVSVEGFLR